MIDVYSLLGIGLGLLGIFALFFATWKFNRPKPNLSEGLITFLTCTAFSAGIKVCILAFDKRIIGIGNNERPYVFLGGLAVIWISLEAIWKTLSVHNKSLLRHPSKKIANDQVKMLSQAEK